MASRIRGREESDDSDTESLAIPFPCDLTYDLPATLVGMPRTTPMLRSATFAAASLLVLGFAQAASGPPANVTAAVSDSARPETDTKRDADRKPADMLVFAQ